MYQSQKTYRNMFSCLDHLLKLFEPVLFYTAVDKFLVAVRAIVFETCAYWAYSARDLQGECYNLAWIVLAISLVTMAFCLVHFLFKKDTVECTFFTNLKIVDEAGT